MASVLSADHYHDEQAAYAWVEARVWPDGPICPHCGSVDRATALRGTSTRIGVHKCRDCRKPFTVKVGTIFESSHVPMHLWLQAIALLTASKKGFSSGCQAADSLILNFFTARTLKAEPVVWEAIQSRKMSLYAC